MSFLSPLFLFAIAAIGLPLLIHLLNLKRPKKLRFSTLAFFEELQKTTIRKIRVKKYLLLLLRLAAISCLALVLARPFLPPGVGVSGNSNAPSLNAILVDNSISMSRIGERGPLLDQARELVQSIEESAKDEDRFILQVTNGEEQYTSIIGHSQLLRRIEEVQLEAAGNYTSKRVRELVQILNDAPYQNKNLFIISDGQLSQLSSLEELEELPRTISRTMFNLGGVEVQNTRILNLESSTNMIGVGLPVNLTATLLNDSEVPISNQFVTLEFNNEVVGQYSVSLDAGASQTYSFEVIPRSEGSSNGKIMVEGDEFTQDNEFFFTIEVPDVRKVLWVSDADRLTQEISYTEVVLQASGDNDSQLSYERVTSEGLGSANLAEVDAIILDGIDRVPEFAFEQLRDFIQNGGGVILFPCENGDINNYNGFLQQVNAGSYLGIIGEFASFNAIASGNTLQEDHPVFSGLFERPEEEELRVANPDVYYFYKFRPSTAPGGFDIITLNTNDPLIREKRFGQGRVIISAIGNTPGWSNFSIRPLYAPFFYQTILYAASSDEGGFANHALGEEFNWVADLDHSSASLLVQGEEIIPETEITGAGTRLKYPAETWNPGWVQANDDEQTYSIAVNLDRSESEFIQYETNENSEIDNQFNVVQTFELEEESLQNEIVASGFGREIWTWFMLAGLLFLIAESLVSIFYKTESV